MNQYVTGAMIRRLREERKLTQNQLAEKLHVTDKAISRWETGRGYPDISLLEPLSAALGVSVIELLSGEDAVNANQAANILKGKFYVCPLCGNVAFSIGQAMVSCCGIVLPPLEAEDEMHQLCLERAEDEYYVSLDHPMEKGHYISFFAALRNDGCEIRKLYPEGNAQARFKIAGTQYLYYYCNRHGLFRTAVQKRR